MSKIKSFSGRSRNAILGVLRFEPASGYEIRKLLDEATSHFWKESYGQIYPTLDILLSEGKIEVATKEHDGRGSISYRILPDGVDELVSWIRSPDILMRPGRNELLLKMFFARKDDALFLIPQVRKFMEGMQEMNESYAVFSQSTDNGQLPFDIQALIGTTIDFGLSAAAMQIEWCKRTIKVLENL